MNQVHPGPPQGQHTDADVISFLTNLITLSDVDSIDDSPDKIIRYAESGEPWRQKVGDNLVSCALYGTKATDVFIVNPFTMKMVGEYSWFSRSRINNFAACLVGLMRTIINTSLESKEPAVKKKRGRKPNEPQVVETQDDTIDLTSRGIVDTHGFLDMISPFVQVADAKMIQELNDITSKLDDFISIYYDKDKRISRFKCLLFSKAQRNGFPKVRVASWKVFQDMVRMLLNIQGKDDDLSEFNYTHVFHGADVFEGLCAILIELYDRSSKYINIVYPDVELTSKLNALRSHMKYFGTYNSTASWCVNVAPTPSVAPQNQGYPTPYSSVPQQASAPNVPVRYTNPIPTGYAPAYSAPYAGNPHGRVPQQQAPHMPVPRPGGYPPQAGMPTGTVPQRPAERSVPSQMIHYAQPPSEQSLDLADMQARNNPFVRANLKR